MAPLSRIILLSLYCCAAVWCDVRYKKIPNALSLAAFVTAVVLSFASCSFEGVLSSLAGAALGLSLLLLPFFLRMVGGGDVKFLAAAGAICGWRLLLPAAFAGMLLGGVLGCAAIAIHHRSFARLKERVLLLASGSLPPVKRGAPTRDVSIPYTIPLSIGLIGAGITRLL